VSSGASHSTQLRAPLDVANLLVLAGMKSGTAQASVSTNGSRLLEQLDKCKTLVRVTSKESVEGLSF
jgi:RNase P/RNase MRP subunit p30